MLLEANGISQKYGDKVALISFLFQYKRVR